MRILWILLIAAAPLVAADINRPMQRFLLPDVKGHDHDSVEWKGKAMVLEFIAPGCPHCIAFSSVLKQVQQKYGDRIAIIAIVNPPTTPIQAQQYIEQNKITYPILLDQGRVAYAYIRKPSFDIPYVFLIDADGMIREAFEYGATTADLFYGSGMMPHVENLLKTASPAGQKK
ncbi:MAG TPA: TlpA disulfide reductase family protein [Bryobacteraceae bacterium]|nr:TlpA disulfide reductase family protein [Bryobacteraceae bacterium]